MRAVWCCLFFIFNVFAFEYINEPTLKEFPENTAFDENRIVGGQEADIINYPHQVSFSFNTTKFCGGFIISKHWIVTAAHCAVNVDPSTIVLRAGSSYRRNGTMIPISKVITHPEFGTPRFDKDVAVFKTQHPINFTDTIKPIKLAPLGRRMRARTYFNASGWGATEEGGSITRRLMEVEIPVVSHTQCRMSYRTLTRNMFCGGNYFIGGQGTCQGDSGGAAVQNGLACGIVSYARGCARPFYPNVFTNIAAKDVREFIRNHTSL